MRLRSIALAIIMVLTLSAPRVAATALDGFVTEVDSPTEFYLGLQRVLLGAKAQCRAEDLPSDIELKARDLFQVYFRLQGHRVAKSELAVSCNALSLTIGSRVLVAGDRGENGDSFTAMMLIVYKMSFQRKFSTSWKFPEWAGEALLEEKPQITRTGHGWTGTVWLDGYPMNIASDTELLTAPDIRDPGIGSFDWFAGLYKYDRRYPRGSAPAPAFLISLFQPNTWAAYQGERRADGHILLHWIGLWPEQRYARRQEQWATAVAPTINRPNYASHAPGSVTFPKEGFVHGKSLAILPDRIVQDYVSRLGASLVPQYQRNTPETSATKVHFRFYVVESTGSTFDEEVSKMDSLPYGLARPSWDDAVLALPNGVILLPTRTLARVESNAQLAAILSSAVASALQEQNCIAWYKDRGYAGTGGFYPGIGSEAPIADAMAEKAFAVGFVLWRDEQAMRIGIRQMYLAGYDIREAPFAWALAAGSHITNPIVDSADTDKQIPWYTAYAFDYISQFYSDVDYSRLKRGRAEYAQFLKELRKADPSAFGSEK